MYSSGETPTSKCVYNAARENLETRPQDLKSVRRSTTRLLVMIIVVCSLYVYVRIFDEREVRPPRRAAWRKNTEGGDR